MYWNVSRGQENPTQSINANNLIAKMKKKEVRKQGKTSQDCRYLELEYIEESQKILMEEYGEYNIFCHYGIPCLMRFQFHLISRIGNSTQFLISNLSLNPYFDFTLRGRLNWSNNIR